MNLRDLAYVLNGSRVQFEVGWNNAVKEINLTSKQPYTATGRELAENETERTAAWSIVSPVLLDNKETLLTGYTIGGDSYFALRDMGEVFDFSVGWFGELGYIVVNTQKSYDEAPLTLEDEYQLIIDSRPLYDTGLDGLYNAVDGLIYADLIDFSNDGISELLLISIVKNNAGEFTSYDVTFDVYGDIQGHAGSYGTITLEYMLGDETIGLYKSGGKTYIGSFHSGAARIANYTYYGLDGTKFIEIESIGELGGWSDEVNGYISTYSKNEIILTEEQFNAEMGKYLHETSILSFQNYAQPPFGFKDRGVLPEIPDITVTVNGETVDIGSDLFLEKGYVMLPLQLVMEKAGVTVCADSGAETILATTKRDSLEVVATSLLWGPDLGRQDEYVIRFNDELLFRNTDSFDEMRAQVINDQVWVPIKPIVKCFGGNVIWDTPTKTYSITLVIPAADQMSLSEVQNMVEFSFEEAKQIVDQAGYIFTYHPADELGYKRVFVNGKAYWWMYILPQNITEDEAFDLFLLGIDKYEAVTVWSDGTITK